MQQSKAIEFWRMRRVTEITGLSKTEIYRRIEAGRFPAPRKYPDSNMNFWPSTEVVAWQRSVVGDEFDALLA